MHYNSLSDDEKLSYVAQYGDQINKMRFATGTDDSNISVHDFLSSTNPTSS